MQVILRSLLSGCYYQGWKCWVKDPERALDFGSVPGAAKFTFEEKLAGMEIILRDDSSGAEIELPVLPEWCLFDERALRPTIDPAPPSLSLAS
jgi:hypothetical protein